MKVPVKMPTRVRMRYVISQAGFIALLIVLCLWEPRWLRVRPEYHGLAEGVRAVVLCLVLVAVAMSAGWKRWERPAVRWNRWKERSRSR